MTAGAEPWNRIVTRREITTVSIIAFFAWVSSVYDYTLFGTLLPELAKEFHWTTSFSTLVNTGTTLGVFVVSLVVGPLLDKLGRKRTLVILMVGGAIASGLTGLVAGAASVIIIRSLTGLSLSEEVVNSVYLNEILKKVRSRGFVYSMVQTGWPIGALLSAGITALLMPIVGWRWTFVIAGLFTLVIIVFAVRLLKESPTFQAIREVKRRLAAGELDAARDLAAQHDLTALVDGRAKAGSLRDVIAPGIRLHTICISGAWLTNWMGIQVFAVLGTTVLVNAKGISFNNALLVLVVSNFAAAIGYLVHGWVGDRIGRRPTILAGWGIGGIVTILMLVLPGGQILTFVLYALTLFFLTGPYGAMLFYMGESFPAHVRGTGANVAHVMAPLGGLAGSALLTVFLASGFTMTASAIFAGSIPMLISAVFMIGARTTNRPRDHRARNEVSEARV